MKSNEAPNTPAQTAWDTEKRLVRDLVRARLSRVRPVSADEVDRLATGILLCCTCDDETFKVVEYFIQLDRAKRNHDKGPK